MIPDGVIVKITVHGKALPQEFLDCLAEVSVSDVSEGQDTATLKFWNADQWMSQRKAFSLGMPVTVAVGITSGKVEKIFDGQIDSIDKTSGAEALSLKCTAVATHDPGYRAPDFSSQPNTTRREALTIALNSQRIIPSWQVQDSAANQAANTPTNYYPSLDQTTLQRARETMQALGAKLACKELGRAVVTDHPSRIAQPTPTRTLTWGVDEVFVGLETETVAHDEPPPNLESTTNTTSQDPKDTIIKVTAPINPADIDRIKRMPGETKESYWERLKTDYGYNPGGPLKIKLGADYRSESRVDAEIALGGRSAKVGVRKVEGTIRLAMAAPVRAMQWVRIKGRYEEDGLYYAESVGHTIVGNSYKQSVKLTNKRA